MNRPLVVLLLLSVFTSGCSAQSSVDARVDKKSITKASSLTKYRWDHGSSNCKNNKDPALDVLKHDEHTFIIRQSKCLTYEAPFIYILIGDNKTMILDTGAISDSSSFSLRKEVESIIGKDRFSNHELVIVHSHGHSDHYQGDASFKNLANATLVSPEKESISRYFGFDNWPQGKASIDLGNRKITVLPTPGHQEEAITFYDSKTKWLLTGDTLYPGYIYIKDWKSYQQSIAALVDFTSKYDVSAILGAHIEMKNESGEYYPIGSTFQPNESPLPLPIESLHILNKRLKATDTPTEIIFDGFIIKPMGRLQKAMSNLVRWISF